MVSHVVLMFSVVVKSVQYILEVHFYILVCQFWRKQHAMLVIIVWQWNSLLLWTSNKNFMSAQNFIVHFFFTSIAPDKRRPRWLSRTRASLGGSVECLSDWWSRGNGFDHRRVRQHSFVAIDHEIFSTFILSRRVVVSFWRKHMHKYWLTA